MTEQERFWAKVVKTEFCWLWTGAMNHKGYGRFGFDGRNGYAHRWSWIHANGEIPDGLQIDHLCRNRACVRPDHLELVTARENTLRGEGIAGRHARATHCKRGHAYTPDNLYYDGPRRWRRCKACTSLSRRRKERVS